MSHARIRVSILVCICLAGWVGWLAWHSEDEVIGRDGYLKDDIQYFAPGPDFPLANEDAALAENQAPAGS